LLVADCGALTLFGAKCSSPRGSEEGKSRVCDCPAPEYRRAFSMMNVVSGSSFSAPSIRGRYEIGAGRPNTKYTKYTKKNEKKNKKYAEEKDMREGGVQDDACDGGLGVVAQVGEQAQASARDSDHGAPQTPGTEYHSIRPQTGTFSMLSCISWSRPPCHRAWDGLWHGGSKTGHIASMRLP
jgi:hypothetical protein